jgi:hypothetical protein
MDPARKGNFGVRLFFEKIARMSSFKRPVLPHLVNIEATGLSVEEVSSRLDDVNRATGGQTATRQDVGAGS